MSWEDNKQTDSLTQQSRKQHGGYTGAKTKARMILENFLEWAEELGIS